MQENRNVEKTCLKTSNRLGQDMLYQMFARHISGKVAKFGSVCFNVSKGINVQSLRGQFLPRLQAEKGLFALAVNNCEKCQEKNAKNTEMLIFGEHNFGI